MRQFNIYEYIGETKHHYSQLFNINSTWARSQSEASVYWTVKFLTLFKLWYYILMLSIDYMSGMPGMSIHMWLCYPWLLIVTFHQQVARLPVVCRWPFKTAKKNNHFLQIFFFLRKQNQFKIMCKTTTALIYLLQQHFRTG